MSNPEQCGCVGGLMGVEFFTMHKAAPDMFEALKALSTRNNRTLLKVLEMVCEAVKKAETK